MKSYLTIVLFMATFALYSQSEFASDISAVTVYQTNAEITRKVTVQLEQGIHQFVLTGISTSIVPSSIYVQFKNTDAILLSAKYEKNYLVKKKDNPEISTLREQLEELKDKLSSNTDKKNSLMGMEDILNKNMDLGGKNSNFSTKELMDLINSYEIKFLEIREKIRVINKKEKHLKEKITDISHQLVEVGANNNRASGNILLQIQSKKAQEINIKCQYTVDNAGWNPLYNLRSEGISENVHLHYKANVFQNTGQDWKNVQLKVSTSNISQNNNRPILSPLYADYYRINRGGYNNKAYATPTNMEISRSAEYEDSFEYNTEIEENQLNVEFVIKGKRSIESDKKDNQIALKSYDLPTEYIYHSVPKLNTGAFLLAKVSRWSQYNLLPGKANLFFEGAFVGISDINPQQTADTLLISMGRDNSIVVERTPIEEMTSSKFITANKKETFAYEIRVKNKKSIPIKIEVLDQIPISQNSEIKIELEEKGNATYTQKLGKLLWTFSIDAGKTKKDSFKYSVKYPKNKYVRGKK